MEIAKISIIIPVLNEASNIRLLLASLQNIADVEVIVADGGSGDETVAIATSFGVKVVLSEPGRAHQMNAGASSANGDILLFLHADTCLPNGFEIMVRRALAKSGAIAGAFSLKIDGNMRSLCLIEKMVNWRSRFFSLPYGDQAIFLKASVFHDIDGFPNLPIMEDFELMLRLRRNGQIVIVPAFVVTSGRRWQKLGVVKTTLINQAVIIGYFLGIPPSQLVCWYRSFRN